MKNFGGGLEYLRCFVFETDTINVIILSQIKPIVINDVNTGYFDSTSPYGYFGPYYKNNHSEADIHLFWSSLMDWYSDHNIVSDFVRFSLNGNESGYPGHVAASMLNVKGEIKNVQTQWSNFERKVRKNVKRAMRENLTFKVHHGPIANPVVDQFYSIYISTMTRTSAEENFFYTKDNFTNLFVSGDTRCVIAMVYSEGIPISAELVLCSDECFYSFLGGTDSTHFDKRPNDFLKYELINWGRTEGFKYFILGGGYGKEDGIYKYKKCFFPEDTVTYHTGRKIISKEIYAELCAKTNVGFRGVNSEEAPFFPSYKIKAINDNAK